MALSYALWLIEAQNPAQITVFGEYLERFPPTHEVTIIDNTSWSCPHGIERWRSNCGCCTHGAVVKTATRVSGGRPGHEPDPVSVQRCEISWSQAWRAPLRGAMDWLRDTLVPIYVDRMN
jgi:hypothetical protein